MAGTIRVEKGTRGDAHLCENCSYSFRIGRERESDDLHFCKAAEDGRLLPVTKKVTVCTAFNRVKIKLGLPLSMIPIYTVEYSDDRTPVFIAPGELGMYDYAGRREYINARAVENNAVYGPRVLSSSFSEINPEQQAYAELD